MASEKSGGSEAAAGEVPAGVHHLRSFKLRFAPRREPGRSNVSLVQPRGLPATVAGKFYAREPDAAPAEDAAEAAALRRVRRMFEEGPREKYTIPPLTSHDYGWWSATAGPTPAWLRHHIRDSAWMRERLRLLAAPPRPR